MVEQKVHWLKHYKLKILLLAIITFLFIEMTDMLNGQFDVSLTLLLTIIVNALVIPILMMKWTERLVSEHYDPDEKNLTNKGFSYFFSAAVVGLSIIIALTFIARWLPLVTFFELPSTTARSVGIIVFIFIVIVTIVLSFWPLTILITIIGGQHLIFIFSENGEEISYTTIVMGTLLVLFVVGVIIMSILIHRDKDELE